MKKYILSLDQGTTSSRALIFNQNQDIIGLGQFPFKQIYPKSGWVEHDPIEIWQTTLKAAKAAIKSAKINPDEIASLAITNQRETTVLWEKATGTPVYNAIVWQDRRTSDFCSKLKAAGKEALVREKTGLLLDPYFSATKLQWLLDNTEVKGVPLRERAKNGELCFGTIDSWLLWNLTGGKEHETDATNASRTMLYNIVTGEWDGDLLELFDVPPEVLPEVMNTVDEFGHTTPSLFGAAIPIKAMAGDQHSALIGQACFTNGDIKSTYGTGCFALQNIGEEISDVKPGLLTTIAYQIKGKPTYAIEGSVFIAGAGVQWLRDEVNLIEEAAECDELAENSNQEDPVCLVPAFTGLGAPYWQADVRGALLNLTRGTGKAEITRATLEAVGFQTRDLFNAMNNSLPQTLRVDGGLTNSNWTMQFLANILNCNVEVSKTSEATALGVAYLAGAECGLYGNFVEFSKQWKHSKKYQPTEGDSWRKEKYQIWQKAIETLIH
ncbi:MAG: glycerol kinase GlpK [Rhodomicrobiaceae bacterium]